MDEKINSLPNDNVFELCILRAFAVNHIHVTQILKSVG